jgi:hypothetical protein
VGERKENARQRHIKTLVLRVNSQLLASSQRDPGDLVGARGGGGRCEGAWSGGWAGRAVWVSFLEGSV